MSSLKGYVWGMAAARVGVGSSRAGGRAAGQGDGAVSVNDSRLSANTVAGQERNWTEARIRPAMYE